MNPDTLKQIESIIEPYLGQTLSELKAINIKKDQITIIRPYPSRSTETTLNESIRKIDKNLNISYQYHVATYPHLKGKQPLKNIKNVIAISSAKGGVGKSTVCANLALALKQEGAKVGVLDADLYGPSQAKIFGIDNQRPEITGENIKPITAHGIQIATIASHLNREDTPLIWRGSQLDSALKTLLFQTEWPELDYLLIDMPPGTGDIQLTISQQIPVSGAVIISTPQEIALLDAKKGLKMFHQVEIPVLGVIENMNLFICPKCGHQEAIFGKDGAQIMSLQYLVNFLGSLPVEKAIQEGCDRGKPIVEDAPESGSADIFREMARKMTAALVLKAQEIEPVVPQTEKDLMSDQIKEIKWDI